MSSHFAKAAFARFLATMAACCVQFVALGADCPPAVAAGARAPTVAERDAIVPLGRFPAAAPTEDGAFDARATLRPLPALVSAGRIRQVRLRSCVTLAAVKRVLANL